MASRISRRRCGACVGVASLAATVILSCDNGTTALAFSPPMQSTPIFGFTTSRKFTSYQPPKIHPSQNANCRVSPLFSSKFEKMNEDDDQVFAFMDTSGENGIDCYIDSYATIDGVEYAIGHPCDYAVALCYFEGDEQLVPIELDEPMMDEVFPIAEEIIEEEFGEELVLLRTPQTLTLVGELEDGEDEDDDDDYGDDINDSEEEVEILVSFEEEGREYHLVRLLDPVLLVGKAGTENTRILLTPEESDIVMPQLEDMFMSYEENGNDDDD